MPQVLAPLPETDYQTIGFSYSDLFEMVQSLPTETQYYVVNATHRLAEVDWITRKLAEDVSSSGAPVVQEGLLSLQVYLLLTCADTLGHACAEGGVKRRFRAFFSDLQGEAKRNLMDNILVWRTSFDELVSLGLGDPAEKTAFYPSRQQIVQSVRSLESDERLDVVVDFLYARRNYYTHESKYPQLGYHPNLSVMQRQRLNVPHTATFGEQDRLQPMFCGEKIYFAYYETDDVVATIRWSVVRGLGQVVREHGAR